MTWFRAADMKSNVRALTRSAVSAALAVVLLYIGTIVPSGRLALTAIAGLAALFVMLEHGGKWAAGVYAVSALLGLLLAPSKAAAILYAAFLGYYPALGSLIERLRSSVVRWVIKFALFNAVLAAMFFLANAVLSDSLSGVADALPAWLLWIGLNAVFFIYDLGLKGLKRFYVRRIAGKGNGVV